MSPHYMAVRDGNETTIPKAGVKPEDTKEFIQKKCRLAVDFGDWFGGDRFNGFIRMNLATSRENVEIGVKRIIDGILGEK